MILNKKLNNFDVIRLLAAWMVLYSHSFALYDNSSEISLLSYDSFSGMALNAFFVISGYLITGSYIRRANLYVFLFNRMLRLLPGLIVVILTSILLLGPILTNKSIVDYFYDVNTYKYLRGILIFPLKYSLPGVFENNPYPNIVNGSLWSLEIEVKCYIAVGALGVMNLLRQNIVLVITGFCLIVYLILDYYAASFSKYIWIFKYGNLIHGFRWFLSFFLGASLYLLKDKIPYNYFTFFIVVILDLILWYLLPLGHYYHIVLMSYLTIYIGLHSSFITKVLNGNDISYGVYIYAFPIQQIYMHYIGTKFGFVPFVALSTIISFFCGYISWIFVEKPCLYMKRNLKWLN